MQLAFSYSFDDYREANRAVFRSQRRAWYRWLGWTLLFTFAALLGLVLITVTIANRATGQSVWPELKRNAIVLAAAVWLLYSALSARSRHIRRGWRAQPALQLGQRLEISDTSLVTDDSQTRVEFKWNAFVRFVESRNVFVLMPTEMSLVIIPKRAFPNAEAVQDFRRLLETRVLRPAPGFPVVESQAAKASQTGGDWEVPREGS
jgi:hypothetical protein